MNITLLPPNQSKNSLLINKAIQVLEQNRLLNIDMIEPLRRGHGQLLYLDLNNILIYEENMDGYLLTAPDKKIGTALIQQLNNCELICIHQKKYLNIVKEKIGTKNHIECHTVARFDNHKQTLTKNLDFKALDMSYLDIIAKHYQNITERGLTKIIEKQHLFGAFKDNHLVGFIGIHLEGSIGLLEVFEEYRNLGYGTELEIYINNYVIDKGYTPFGQVLKDNKKSLNLQRKIGNEISKETIFWIF